MRKLPKVTRKRDHFAKKIIITIPPWAVPIVAGAILVGSALAGYRDIITAACLLITLGCMIFTRKVYHDFKEVRYALHNALNDIENEDPEEPGDPHLYEVPSA